VILSVHLLRLTSDRVAAPAVFRVTVPAPMGFLERQRRLAVWSEYAIANSVTIPPITRYHKLIRQYVLPGLPLNFATIRIMLSFTIAIKKTLSPPSAQKQSAVKVERGVGGHLNNYTRP
jgi:hypothetical protein